MSHYLFQRSDLSWPAMAGVNTSLGLFLDQPSLINQVVEPAYGWLNCVISLITIIVNIWAVRVLRKKESESLTNLVIWDCLINILISNDELFIHSNFWAPIQIQAVCTVKTSTFMTLLAFTRLVPVAIVLLRYFMVCQPAFFINNGQEKGILKWVVGGMVALCLFFWTFLVYTSPINFRVLRCMGREEAFW